MLRSANMGWKMMLSFAAVAVLLTGLTSTSCAKKQQEYEPPATFKAEAPSVGTKAATNITGSGATLNGVVNSPGSAVAVGVSFEYGLTSAYGSTANYVGLVAKGQSFKVNISGLSP